MNANLIVIDNFYSDADTVRDFALSQSFDRTGNYPGSRTKNFIDSTLKTVLQNILYSYSGDVIDWNDESGYTGSFQLTTSKNKSWIHTDKSGNWGGVLYLTPDAPVSGGTGFFKSKLDGSLTEPDNFSEVIHMDMVNHQLEVMMSGGQPDTDTNKIYSNMEKWDIVNQVGNVYNRLILFRSNQWHSSLQYFGEDNETGRLTQVFFIKAEH